MAATTTNTLQAISVAAEQAFFAQPVFTCIDTGSHTALDANVAPAGNAGNQSIVRMLDLALSLAAAAATALTLTVVDDTTVIWQCEIPAAAPLDYFFDFTSKPLRASAGKTLHAKLGDPGVGKTATITWSGDYVRNTQG